MEPSLRVDLDFNLTMLARPFELDTADWRRYDIQAGVLCKKPLDGQEVHELGRLLPGALREANASSFKPPFRKLRSIRDSSQGIDHDAQRWRSCNRRHRGHRSSIGGSLNSIGLLPASSGQLSHSAEALGATNRGAVYPLRPNRDPCRSRYTGVIRHYAGGPAHEPTDRATPRGNPGTVPGLRHCPAGAVRLGRDRRLRPRPLRRGLHRRLPARLRLRSVADTTFRAPGTARRVVWPPGRPGDVVGASDPEVQPRGRQATRRAVPGA